MRRLALATIVLAACDFTPGEATVQPDAGVTAIGRTCHVTDPALRLCLDFEDPSLTPYARDGSTLVHDAKTSQIGSMPRAGQQAALIGPTSQIRVSPTADLDIVTLTLEMWIQPSSLVGFPIVNNGQYALGLDGTTAECAVGDVFVTSRVPIGIGQWHHVACTYDQTRLQIYVDGAVTGCQDAQDPLIVNARNGTAVGPGYVGGVDNVHVYARALFHEEICRLTGRTDCPHACQ